MSQRQRMVLASGLITVCWWSHDVFSNMLSYSRLNVGQPKYLYKKGYISWFSYCIHHWIIFLHPGLILAIKSLYNNTGCAMLIICWAQTLCGKFLGCALVSNIEESIIIILFIFHAKIVMIKVNDEYLLSYCYSLQHTFKEKSNYRWNKDIMNKAKFG